MTELSPEDYTIEDLLEMEPRERDRIAAEWISEVGRARSFNHEDHWSDWEVSPQEDWPKYSKFWRHCGRLLEALPPEYRTCPVRWMTGNLTYGPEGAVEFMRDTEPALKDHIVLAACICWLRGIEPEKGGEL